MIISVQRGLENIKERLEGKGYKTVYSDEYPHSADAFIYVSRVGESPVFAMEMQALNGLNSFNNSGRLAGGALEINAYGLSFEEIEKILLSGRQSNLFG